jgi:hypothetical protein
MTAGDTLSLGGNNQNNGGSPVFNFDFRGATVADKNQFVRDVTNALSRSFALAKQGVL